MGIRLQGVERDYYKSTRDEIKDCYRDPRTLSGCGDKALTAETAV